MTREPVERHHIRLVVPARASQSGLAAAVVVADKLGCSAVELASGPVHSLEEWEMFRASLASNGLTCAGIALNADDINLGATDARRSFVPRHDISKAVDRARWLAASYVRVAAATPNAADECPGRYEDIHHHVLEALLSLRHEAGLEGIRIVLEVGASGFLGSPPEARHFIDAVNSPWVGASINLAGCNSAIAAVDWIKTLTHRIGVVRMEGPTAAGLDWDAIGRALTAERFDGFIVAPSNIEFNNDGRLNKCLSAFQGAQYPV